MEIQCFCFVLYKNTFAELNQNLQWTAGFVVVACCVFPLASLFVSCVCSSISSPETLISSDCWADTHTKEKETDCMHE